MPRLAAGENNLLPAPHQGKLHFKQKTRNKSGLPCFLFLFMAITNCQVIITRHCKCRPAWGMLLKINIKKPFHDIIICLIVKKAVRYSTINFILLDIAYPEKTLPEYFCSSAICVSISTMFPKFLPE